MKPRISIVLPTYNQAKYLPEALASVFSQTYRDFELVVVNDGSTDETASILTEYRTRYDFILIEQQNQGLPKALNVGFRQAQGEYLTWTSSDNILLPDMLARLSTELDEYPEVGLVYADWYVIDEMGRIIAVARSRDYDRLLLLRTNYINACFLYRRECQEKIGWYNTRFSGAEDWDYWLRISKYYTMRHVKQLLYKYRVHGNTLSAYPEMLIPYKQFAKFWKRVNPLAWYASKVKWHLLKRVLGRSPAVSYQPFRPV